LQPISCVFKGREHNTENNDFSPLHHAALNSNPAVVRLLVEEYGWDVNQIDDDHETPMSLVVDSNYQSHRWEGCVDFFHDHRETMHILLQNGADPQRGGRHYYDSPL
jgi:ankyrin repeat protein